MTIATQWKEYLHILLHVKKLHKNILSIVVLIMKGTCNSYYLHKLRLASSPSFGFEITNLKGVELDIHFYKHLL
jgi:hypothetical protein